MFDVLGTDFEKLGSVENPSSANYSIYWQETGAITLIAAATKNNLSMLGNDRYILVNDPARRGLAKETVYVIVNVVIDEENNQITVNGKTADFLLRRRSMPAVVLENTRARDAVATMIDDNLRGLPIVTAISGYLDDTQIVRYPMDGGAVDKAITELMQFCGIGKTVHFDGDCFVFSADSGRDMTSAAHVPVFGRGSGTARNPTISVDYSDFCNVATATLKFKDGRSVLKEFGSTEESGIARRELYCGEVTQKSGESEEDFQSRAETEMDAALSEHIQRISVSALIDPRDLSRFYQLGDIVRVKIGGYLLKKRVTGITWLKDQLNDNATLILGDPKITVIAEVKEETKAVSRAVGGVGARVSRTEEEQKLIQQDYKSLVAKVDDVVAGMDAYVLNNTLEEYKLAVNRNFATISDDVSSISADLVLVAEKTEELESASATLSTRVGDAEASLTLQAEKIADNEWAIATLDADVIKLQGDVNVGGNLTLTDGNIIALTEIIAAHGLTIGTDHITIYGKDYKPTEITSTTGTVRVLGIA